MDSASSGSLSGFIGTPKAPRRALVGFDGFVDSLYRVIRDHTGGSKNPYADIPEFARELLTRAGRGSGFELSRMSVRAGGNAPLMATGLTALGVSTSCVGALGLPELDPAFRPLRDAGCELFSAAPASLTTALEFGDGKLMFNDSRAFEGLGWKELARIVGLERLRFLATHADLIALVDWANMPLSSDLWRGLLEEVLAPAGAKNKKIFFDLADISRAGAVEIRELTALLGRFRDFGEVAVGLNGNESLKLAGRLDLAAESGKTEDLAQRLRAALALDMVVIHLRDRACVADAGSVWTIPGRLVQRPLLSTGAGDHFNAGFCYGWLQGLPPAGAASLGGAVASLYVEQGRSPDLDALKAAPLV